MNFSLIIKRHLKSTLFILINYKIFSLSLDVHTPDPWYHVLREKKSNARWSTCTKKLKYRAKNAVQ